MTKQWKILTMGVALLGAVACDTGMTEEIEPAEAEPVEDVQTLADGEERFGDGAVPIADVRVDGSRFLFVQLEGPDGEPLGVGTVEQLADGAADPAADERLADATPLELFWAITPEGTEVPPELLAYEMPREARRGWFLDQPPVASLAAASACSDSTFVNSLRNWSPEINDGEKWRLNTGATDGGNWTGPTCGSTGLGCNAPSFYSLYKNNNDYAIYNVDEMKQQVAICGMNSSRTVCSTYGGCVSHLGPTVKFGFRKQGNTSPGFAFTRDMTASDLHTTWRWRWFGSPVGGVNANWDWRIQLVDVKQGDQFDLGWIWEHRGW